MSMLNKLYLEIHKNHPLSSAQLKFWPSVLWELVDINSEWKEIQLPEDTLRDVRQIAVSTNKNNLKIFCGKIECLFLNLLYLVSI